MSDEEEKIPLINVPESVLHAEENIVKQQMLKKGPTETLTKEKTQRNECTELLKISESHTDGKQTTTISEGDSIQMNSKIESISIKEVIKYVKDMLKKTVKKQRITFLDFAGHSMYYAFHQIYLSPKTFYILVVDMDKSPDTPCETSEIYGSRFASWTYKGNVIWSTNKKISKRLCLQIISRLFIFQITTSFG